MPTAPCAGPRAGRASCWGSGSGRAASEPSAWSRGGIDFFWGGCHPVNRHLSPVIHSGKAKAN